MLGNMKLLSYGIRAIGKVVGTYPSHQRRYTVRWDKRTTNAIRGVCMKQMSQQNCSENFLSGDEIDALFSQLLQVEPPPSLIGNILSSVANLKSERVWKPI